MSTTNGPPRSVEAEILVLGACLQDESMLPTVVRLLEPPDFYRAAHQRIYATIRAVWESGGSPDVLAVMDRLRASGELQGVGGGEYLAEILDAVPTTANVEQHAVQVAETATLRRIIHAATTTVEDAKSGESAEDVLAKAHARLLEARRTTGAGYRPVGSDVVDVMAEIEREVHGEQQPGVPTGIPRLDHLTGGLRETDLVVLAARPSMGKTALALQIGLHASRLGHRVLVASLEMSRRQLVRRGLVQLSRMPVDQAFGAPDRSAQFDRAATRLATLPIAIDDQPGETIDALRAGVHRAAAEEAPALIVVDYLQLMTGQGESRVQQVGAISRGLKLLARDMGCPVLALSQLSRAVEHRAPPRPILADLRDSGTIEQDADVVLLLWRPEYYFDDRTKEENRAKLQGKGELIVAKQRNGPTGAVWLIWDAPTTTFTEAAWSTGAIDN